MENSAAGKSPNTSFSFRYNANNEVLEELYSPPPVVETLPDASPSLHYESSPKKSEKTPSILDKYFKSMREKAQEKPDDGKPIEITKSKEDKDGPSSSPKDVLSSPMKDYLNRLGKKSTDGILEGKESNETWKIFHDFKYKIAQAVEDMKTRSLEEPREKSVPRENSTSDSEENSAIKDSDQQSVGDTDNQVSSLGSSIQNLSEISHALTAKAIELEDSNMEKKSDVSDETHKNIAPADLLESTKDSAENSSILDIESGVEALEDNLDGFTDFTSPDLIDNPPIDTIPITKPPTPTHIHLSPSKIILKTQNPEKPKTYFLHFPMYLLTFILLSSFYLFPNRNILHGFLLGLWFFYFISNLKQYILDNYFSEWEKDTGCFFGLRRSSRLTQSNFTIPFVKEHRPVKKYEGWINHYRYPDYNPYTYHINKTTTAFMKLEGCNLRISYTRTKIAKRALWDEKIDKVVFYQHRIFNLTGARVILLPKGLVRKRQWSKKYPICVILSEKEKIQVLEKEGVGEKKIGEDKRKDISQSTIIHDTETSEMSTSPEKKKKFVWRKKDKNVPHTEVEPGKEGLRHRLVRKMHRDKKVDNAATNSDSVEEQSQTEKNEEFQDAESDLVKHSAEEDLDETELSRILEDAEMQPCAVSTLEGEWSVHVKESKDKHSHLYLFGRTGRDKHEWYRRLVASISGANASTESSAAEDQSKTEANPASEKNGIEMVSYKVSDKEVTIPKNACDSAAEGVSVSSPTTHLTHNVDSYEKLFWPYFFKIIQSHSKNFTQTKDVSVMCEIEPSANIRLKTKKSKKKKHFCGAKTSAECSCVNLPAEVMWLNGMIARIVYDVMRDPEIIARVQNKIQRKLKTLKLPSFMSPLVITELSLIGSCPLVEKMSPPSWDERGVWIDADIRYTGGAFIAILTQINLMKLKEKNASLEEQVLQEKESEDVVEQEDESSTVIESKEVVSERQLRKAKPAIFDSDVEDSAESSDDDETQPDEPVDSGENPSSSESLATPGEGGSSKKKFLRMVDKIATNKYFQQVTDYKYVKRAMEGISNTDIKLHLEVQGLEGRLALNIPSPPHDRVWAGFRTNPHLILKARPAFGARTLRFAHISNWIEQKLSKEFEKVLVLPNMEDVVVDFMTPTPVEFE